MFRTPAIAALALLAAGLAPAWAQQNAPASPAAAASAPKPPPPPPMINRWVDAHGEVHYGDVLPADAPARTTEVGPLQSATPEQKAQADAQLQQYRNALQPPPAAPEAAAPETAPAENPQSGDDSCAGQWARFNAAAACANQYRVVGGGLKQDMAQHCPVVPQPQCPPPPGNTSVADQIAPDLSFGDRASDPWAPLNQQVIFVGSPGGRYRATREDGKPSDNRFSRNQINPAQPEARRQRPPKTNDRPNRKPVANASQGQAASSNQAANRPLPSRTNCQSQPGAGCRP